MQLVTDFQASGRLDKQPDFAVDDKVGWILGRGCASFVPYFVVPVWWADVAW